VLFRLACVGTLGCRGSLCWFISILGGGVGACCKQHQHQHKEKKSTHNNPFVLHNPFVLLFDNW
jgi:uncharacterized membrane protein YsdA (DUF1294 family)